MQLRNPFLNAQNWLATFQRLVKRYQMSKDVFFLKKESNRKKGKMGLLGITQCVAKVKISCIILQMAEF